MQIDTHEQMKDKGKDYKQIALLCPFFIFINRERGGRESAENGI